MFAGRRRRSSNIRAMQLFHELKQQFPTVPDHVVSACIASHAHSASPNKSAAIRQILEAAAALDQEPMGRSPPPTAPCLPERIRTEMNDSESDRDAVKKSSGVTFSKKYESVSVCTSSDHHLKLAGRSAFYVKRPDHLDIKPETSAEFHNIRLSEKCKDVHKLLNSDNVCDKPPRSPLTPRRPKSSPTTSPDAPKKATASTPTQTTDTLLGGGSVNLSLNVNCSMDVVQSPTRRKSVLEVTPQQPWLQEPTSSRSYTSVNLTLRPPSSEPQAPIDITSQNSSLTYSTSSFDSQKGLQSRLQITVGPGGGSVSSTRARPRSSYHPEQKSEVVPCRAGSLNNLTVSNEPPVILKQEVRIERLRIELRSEKAKLEIMQKEVTELEGNRVQAVEHKIDAEVEKQLRREIKHLQYQCEQLALEADKSAPTDNQEDFYHNIYTGQRGPLNLDMTGRLRRPHGGPPPATFHDGEGPKWNCHLCTFLNHPDLDKCEQCEMPRILHGKPPPDPNINNNTRQPPPTNYNLVPAWNIPTNREPMVVNRPIGFVMDNVGCVAQNLNNATRPR